MGAPADFVTFVATYSRPLTAACQEITGNDRLAERLRLDLLATAALRWRSRAGAGRTRTAVARLNRHLRREVRTYHLLPPPAGLPTRTKLSYVDSVVDRPVESEELARSAWREAARLRRQALVAVAAAALAMTLFALVGPVMPDEPAPRLPEPDVPLGVILLPRYHDLGLLPQITSPVPPSLSFVDTSGPVSRAVAVIRSGAGPLILVGADGAARQVVDPQLAQARLVTTSLSPTGDRVVLALGDGLLVLTVATGELRRVDAGSARPEPPVLVWRGSHSVLVPALDGTHEIDLDTGTSTTLAGVTGVDVVSPEGSPDDRLTELLTLTSTAGQSSRIRLWRSPPGGPDRDVEDRPIFGPQWIGNWSGPGWSSPLLFVRACDPRSITLPDRFGPARSAIGAVGVNGIYAGTLVTVDDTVLAPLGFLQPQTVLLAANYPQSQTLLAWIPTTGYVARVATSPLPLTTSIADLLTRPS